MNLVGKILTVFIFVMTIVFMTLSVMVYSTHTDWRTLAKSLQAQLTVANQDKSARPKSGCADHRLDRRSEPQPGSDWQAAAGSQSTQDRAR